MPQVRCPRCEAINDTRAPGYPFCVGCQDNLARCGYCQWFDDSAVVCTHPLVAGVFEVSEEATPPCGYHAPSQTLRVRRWGVRVLVGLGLAAAVFALGYGLMGLFEKAPPPPPPPANLEWAIEADIRGAVVGKTYTVTVLIRNPTKIVVTGVQLEIAQKSLDVFFLQEVRPEPLARSRAGEWRVYTYPELHPLEQRRIALELVPRIVPQDDGGVHLMVRLRSGDGQYHHGQADLPIKVAEAEDRE